VRHEPTPELDGFRLVVGGGVQDVVKPVASVAFAGILADIAAPLVDGLG
jgi:hypothetical protein